MATQIRLFDWSATPLGPLAGWPQSLRTAVDLMLDSVQPAYIAWGDKLTSLFNDSYAPILGDKHECPLGQPLYTLFPEIEEEYQPILLATLAGQAHSFVDQPVPLRGRALPLSWFTFSWTPLRDEMGDIRGFYCAAFETTEKVMARDEAQARQREALITSEQRYRMLFDAIDEGFCIIEVLFEPDGRPYDYRFLEANPAFERHTGLEGSIGRTVREFAPGHEQHWFDIYGEVAKTGEPIRFENHAEQIDGRWFDLFAFRVGMPEQHRVAVLFTDISERKKVQDALHEADRRKDEFLATLAHELRNPLAPLRNGLHIARLTGGTDERTRQVLDMMDRQLTHLVRLVDDLLDVGRISSGKLELMLSPVELRQAVATGIESTRSAVEANGHRLDVTPPSQPLWVLGDHDRLAQVFTNLLSNAAKYTEYGGRIDVQLQRDGDEAVVTVTDTGIGIPAEAAGQVFDLFSQVREHQGRYGGGLGIGLALVRRLVALHGGSVQAASAGEGRGSTFTVRLPALATPAQHAALPSTLMQPAAPTSRRIIVADDNPDAAESLALLLRAMGHQVWEAADGAEVLALLDEASPDVVFLDLGMPVMGGLEAAQRIRALPAHHGVCLVALTGWGQDQDRSRTAAAGFNWHLVKPVDPAEVERLLD